MQSTRSRRRGPASSSGLTQRKDYGFVVEHRWSEKITNIVATLPEFLKARDELLDLALPLLTESIEKEFGRDLRPLGADDLHPHGCPASFLEDASLTLYDAAAGHGSLWDDRKPDPELEGRLAALFKRIGFDLADVEASDGLERGVRTSVPGIPPARGDETRPPSRWDSS